MGRLGPLLAVLLTTCTALGGCSSDPGSESTEPVAAAPTSAPTSAPSSSAHPPASRPPRQPYRPIPAAQQGTRGIFGDGRFLVAYYGTAGTGSLGVLGETPPEEMQRRLERAAETFARPEQPVQEVYELIVTVADRVPGEDGSFSHDIARADVQRYLDAARRHDALVLLDLQPGRSDFLTVAKRWAWALRQPHVGLALDPEWRMHGRDVPGERIGWVDAAEVNRVSLWLTELQRRERLPQKLFVLHQFRSDMIRRIGSVQPRDGLAMVQHVDGFGTPSQKLATFHAVKHPPRFLMGFKLFYDEDVPRMSATAVHRVRPKVRFVSFQ